MFRDTFPFSPRSFPFFYGWIILIVATLGTISSIPGQTMGVSVFTDHLLEALGLTRTNLSLAYMIGTFCSGVVMLRAGSMVDSFGVRRAMVVAACGLGVSLYGMSTIDAVSSTLSEFFGGPAAFVCALVGFFSIRFFGQGLLALIPRVMLGKWFDKRRGLVMGLSGIFIAFGFGVSPQVLQMLVDSAGWRGAYQVLAVVFGVGMATVSYIFYRERPQDFGLHPDGDVIDETQENEANATPMARDFTLPEARRTFAFWIFSLGLASQGLVVTAVTFHITSLAVSSGVTPEKGLSLFLPMAVLSAVANLTGGWASDKTKMKYVLMTLMTGQLTGTLGLLFLNTTVGQILVIVGYGTAGGLFGTLVGVAWPRFFGMAHLGAISGFNMAIMVFGSSLGPILFGKIYDQTGSYTYGLIACMCLGLSILVGSFFGNNPQDTSG